MSVRWIQCGCVAVVLAAGSPAGRGQDSSSVIKELQQQVRELRGEVNRLKEGPPRDQEAADLLGRSFLKSRGLSFSFYGEAKYRFPEAGSNVFDPHRFVLGPSYQINDWLVFNSELEFEHGGTDESAGRGSRFNGEIELEQMYVDILLHRRFNIRSLGIDLVPVGRINKHHEPTTFYSTERPELYREIIPSTWMEPGFGFFGKLTDSLDYQVMVSTGLEDFVTGGTGLGTGAGITAGNGLRDARPRMRVAGENSLAYSGRLNYRGIPGLDASVSFYTTQVKGFGNGSSWVSLADIEALYRIPNTGIELRGEFAHWHINQPQNLIANNTGTATDDVGRRLYGWYLEAAYHLWPEAWKHGRGRNMDLVPFVRYSQIITQSGLLAGSAELDNGTANKDFLTAGVAWFLNENFVVKGDWRRNLNGSTATKTSGASQDYFQLGVGMFF